MKLNFIGWILLLGFLFENAATAEKLTLSKRTEVFDLQNPQQLIGYFDPNTALEVLEYNDKTKMFRVRFIPPNGQEVLAYCKPEALGKLDPALEGGSSAQLSSEVPVFDSLLKFENSIWKMEPSGFALKQSRFGFMWVSSTDQSASRCGEKLAFLDFPVYETIARFDSNQLNELTILLFGRGDVEAEIQRGKDGKKARSTVHDFKKRDLTEEGFEAAVKKVEESLIGWLGTRGNRMPVSSNALNVQRQIWLKAPLEVSMEWSFTKSDSGFRPEFIRLKIAPFDGSKSVAEVLEEGSESQPVKIVRAEQLKERVKKEDNGDVYLSPMPMVDQGPKGYCVVASAERVLRYFGMDFDQNEIAKVSNASAQGTDPDEMLKSLSKIAGRYSLITRAVKPTFSADDFIKELSAYNTLALKKGKTQIKMKYQDRGHVRIIDVGDSYDKMEMEILREIRLRNYFDKKKFVQGVISYIDKGDPLLWCVKLGMVKEKPELPQVAGGHMRLIIGYNQKNSDKMEIIYTDSWGAGHEFKRMALDDAYFISGGLYAVSPTL